LKITIRDLKERHSGLVSDYWWLYEAFSCWTSLSS